MFYNPAGGNDVLLVEQSTPTTVYVEDTAWSGFVPNQYIADADFGTAGDQPAVYGVTAFSQFMGAAGTGAINSSAPDAVIVVNDGTYAEQVNLSAGTRTLRLTKFDSGTNGTAILDSLDMAAGTVDLQTNTLAVGDAAGTHTIAGAIQGTRQADQAGDRHADRQQRQRRVHRLDVRSPAGRCADHGTALGTSAVTLAAGTLEIAGGHSQ